MKWLLALSIGCCLITNIHARQIHKERSLYRNIVIVEKNDLLCMRFETRKKRVSNQACYDTKDPKRAVFEYVQGTLLGYAINPEPRRILIIGLGGGTLSSIMHEISPQAEIINVEIDPAVVKLARKYFNYVENKKVKTVVQDGRVYIKRALLKQQKFDWIVLDAFNGDYIPEHLMTREFLQEVKTLLTEDGILSANTFSRSKLYHFESATYQNVFKQLQVFRAPTKGNRVIFAKKHTPFTTFPAPNQKLVEQLNKYKIDTYKIWRRITDKIDWDKKSEILTDQYSPANLLQ